MNYKAIFFDRDNTLTCVNTQVSAVKKKLIEEWSGKKYEMNYGKMMDLFDKCSYPKSGLKSVEEEIKFWKRYYTELLKEEGIEKGIKEKSEMIFEQVWLKERTIFPEVIEVLEYFKSQGYKMGVISDTSPSLQITLEALDIGRYFDCYICSDLVGVMKPDKKIYQTAIDALGVKAEESLYVDDYDIEADGARNMGFTAFHIDRRGKDTSQWGIKSLKEIIEYVESRKG